MIADSLGAGRGFRFVGEHPELPPPSVGIPPNTIIVRCACGAEYHRIEEKFLIPHSGHASCEVCRCTLEFWSEATHVPTFYLVKRPSQILNPPSAPSGLCGLPGAATIRVRLRCNSPPTVLVQTAVPYCKCIGSGKDQKRSDGRQSDKLFHLEKMLSTCYF